MQATRHHIRKLLVFDHGGRLSVDVHCMQSQPTFQFQLLARLPIPEEQEGVPESQHPEIFPLLGRLGGTPTPRQQQSTEIRDTHTSNFGSSVVWLRGGWGELCKVESPVSPDWAVLSVVQTD